MSNYLRTKKTHKKRPGNSVKRLVTKQNILSYLDRSKKISSLNSGICVHHCVLWLAFRHSMTISFVT